MEIQTLTHTKPEHPTPFLQWEREFFAKLEQNGKSVNTLKNYKTDLECFKKYLLEKQHSLDIGDFNLQKTQEYGEYLQNKYSSDNSRRRRIQALRIFFDYLVQNQIKSENPVRKLPSSPKFLDIPRPTSHEDLKKLWNHLCEQSNRSQLMEKVSAARNQVIFLLIYTGGLKVSDLAKMKLSHVEVEHPRVMVVPPKRDPYMVPVNPLFKEVFARYLDLLNDAKAFSKIEFDHLLFNANPFKILNGGLSARGLELMFEDFRKRLGIQVTPKSLRQAAIFNWLHKRIGDSTIKEWMGVAPSYSLKLYKEHMDKHLYSDDFLEGFFRETLQ